MLEITEGKRVNIRTDSNYIFEIIHSHEIIWKKRGFLLAQMSPIKYKEEVSQLLQCAKVKVKRSGHGALVKLISLETLQLIQGLN